MDAWSAAVIVVAAAYDLPTEEIAQESRGRVPRPPARVWEARKMAVFIAVSLSGCDYATLGRELGLHKDTISSHCSEIRRACEEDDTLETMSNALEQAADAQLAAQALRRTVVGKPRSVGRAARADRARLLLRTAETLRQVADWLASDEFIRPFHPTPKNIFAPGDTK